MSNIESWHDKDNRAIKFRGQFSDIELIGGSRDELRGLIERVRHELVCRIVDRLMERLGPALDDALEAAMMDVIIKPPDDDK